jgi:hypothetical protein
MRARLCNRLSHHWKLWGSISGGTQVGSETPAVVEEYFSGLAQGGLTSGWLWNLESIGIANAKSYAEAVTAGLGS